MNLDDIYTPLEEAKEEIQRRWEDKELKKKVDDFLGGDIPDFLLDSPKAYLARHVASPNFEFFLFKELVNKIGLEYVISEFTDDIFTPENTSKYHLGKMFFEGKVGKRGGKEIVTELVIDFNKSNGKRIKEIKTLGGECLADFHHKLFNEQEKDIGNKIYDFSDWLRKYDCNPEKFYVYFLALFIRNGILFENFLESGREKDFTHKVVVPAFERIFGVFKIKPLVVRLLPKETEDDIYWDSYSSKYLKNKI
jgi:hypothetical protein